MSPPPSTSVHISPRVPCSPFWYIEFPRSLRRPSCVSVVACLLVLFVFLVYPCPLRFTDVSPTSLYVQAGLPPPDILEQLFTNLIALVPLEYVRSFTVGPRTKLPGWLFFMMPNIETLCISDIELSEGFLQPNPGGPHANMKLLPSLRLLRLEDVRFLDNDDWDHLTTYLAHQTSDSQAISLEVVGDFAYMRPEAVVGIEDLVEKVTWLSKFSDGRMSGDVLAPNATYFD